MELGKSGKGSRLQIVDVARGVAIIAMVIYHLFWDLSYFRIFPVDVGYDPGWVFFARSILFTFMFLVGVGLVLGHGTGVRWRSFWKRWAFVAAGAAIITVSTYLTFPDTFVYFGVLHAIAAVSVLALPFLFTPLWLTGLAGLIIAILPFVFTNPFFDQKITSWIGFSAVPPPANDLVPLFPWLGVALLGVAAMRSIRANEWDARLAQLNSTAAVARGLAFLGRWSLLIYLLHQPILLGVLTPLAGALGTQEAAREIEFLSACQTTCETNGTTAEQCAIYCQCGLAGIERDQLWDPIYSGVFNDEQQDNLDANNRQCSVLIYPELEGTLPEL
ncbi:heparan-alpha-glucosaminide N-acetyltransferase [Devosia sp. MC1541]|uniref:DUF1624 domain-containing protein n=1 Tax=Devosia sp. MC1541 TaxID=2725264 RepID=UPI00145FA683|nr:heparan-alpha-glucosaminide N-acetyltransferase [Devosia sp. MC1541]